MVAAFEKDGCTSWLYLTVVSLVVFFTIGFLDAYGVFMVFLVDHYKESNSKTAWVGSLTFFCTFFLYPFTLHMREKLGHRVIVLLAGALVVPTFLLSPSMPTMNLLFLTFSVPFGVTCSIIDCATVATISEYFDKYRGVAFGLRIGTAALGTMMYSFSLPVLMSEIGWKTTFGILISMSCICVFYASVYRRPLVECSVAGTEPLKINSSCKKINVNLIKRVMRDEDDLRMYHRLLKDKKFLMFLLPSITFYAVVLMPPIFMVRFAVNIGYHMSKAKWLIIARTIASVVTRFTVGRFADMASKHKKIKYIVFIIMTLFSISTLVCSLTTYFPLLVMYMVFVSIVDSVYWIIQPLFVTEVTEGIHSDKGYALFNCIGSFAMLGGPPVLGWFYDVTQDFNCVFYATSAVSAIAACLMALGILLSTRYCSLSLSPLTQDLTCKYDTSLQIQPTMYITAV